MERIKETVGKFLAALVAAALCAAVAASAASAVTQYRITGHGWGHGIGLSQYGAKGFAERGYTAPQIVTYYYTGAYLGKQPADAGTVRVRLSAGRVRARVEVDTTGVVLTRATGTKYNFQVGDWMTMKAESGKLAAYRVRNGVSTKLFGGDTAMATLSGPAGGMQPLFTADNGAYGHHYRGSLRFHLVAGTITVVNRVGMSSYLYSVVPAEMPNGWPTAALRAQAIAARSYAIATRKAGIFDEYADTRSQMYLGIEHEKPSTTAAVNATAGNVLKYAGAVIPAFFSSTSGGRTAAIEDAWNSAARPYLKTKADPYEKSPYTNWPELGVYTSSAFANKLGSYIDGALIGVYVRTNPSYRVDSVIIRGSRGEKTMTGGNFQSRFGLRTTWFRVAKLSLYVKSSNVPVNSYVYFTGVAPRDSGTVLQYRNWGSATWTTVRTLSVNSDSRYSTRIKLTQDRTYRLKRGVWNGPAIAMNAQ